MSNTNCEVKSNPLPVIKKFRITDAMINELSTNPSKIYAFGLYLTRECNIGCIFCLSDAGQAQADELTLEKRLALVKEAYELGARQLIISGAGEPFLDPGFWDVIELAHDVLGMYVIVHSNATCITEQVAQKVMSKERLSIMAKKFSFNREVNNYLYGGEYVDQVEAGFNNLMKAGLNKETPTRLGFQVAITRINLPEIPDILRYARHNNLFPQINQLFLTGRARENPNLVVNTEEYRKLYLECKRIDAEEFGIHWDSCWLPDNPIIAGCCVRPKFWVMVDDVGEMRACSIDLAAIIGNCRNSTILEVLEQNAERVLQIRNSFQENDCYACNEPDESCNQKLQESGRDFSR